MNDFGPTNPQGPFPGSPTNATSEPSVAGSSGGTGAAPPPPPALSPIWSAPAPLAQHARRPKVRRLLAKTERTDRGRCADVCGDRAPRQPGHVPLGHSRATRSRQRLGTGAANARSAPAQGGASGTVASASKSSFTMTTSAGQKVTVDEKSSTKYEKGTASTSAKAVTKGQTVLVLGTVNSTTITATQVVVGYEPASSAASTAKVVPFEKGEPTTSKQVGQIPANWSAGSGTIVSGTRPNKATEAALAAYPGAIVDRVVKLSNGEYNVHYIGVNWPHHVFESSGFKVVGAL